MLQCGWSLNILTMRKLTTKATYHTMPFNLQTRRTHRNIKCAGGFLEEGRRIVCFLLGWEERWKCSGIRWWWLYNCECTYIKDEFYGTWIISQSCCFLKYRKYNIVQRKEVWYILTTQIFNILCRNTKWQWICRQIIYPKKLYLKNLMTEKKLNVELRGWLGR